MRIALPLLALVAFTLPALAADDAQLIVEGKRLAEINCTRCHNVEATGESPLTDAPPFREIATNYDRDEMVDGSKQTETEAGRGFDLLRTNCARCHAIDETSTSPNEKAPPFRAIVAKYDPNALEEALAEGIVTGHNDMPEFAFEPGDVTAIISYLDTLKAR